MFTTMYMYVCQLRYHVSVLLYPYPVSIDFGVEHLVELAGTMNFPWLMSNVCDKHTGRLLAEGKRKLILEWKGKKVRDTIESVWCNVVIIVRLVVCMVRLSSKVYTCSLAS